MTKTVNTPSKKQGDLGTGRQLGCRCHAQVLSWQRHHLPHIVHINPLPVHPVLPVGSPPRDRGVGRARDQGHARREVDGGHSPPQIRHQPIGSGEI